MVHYEISGPDDAPVLVFLHGNGENLHIFDRHIDYFAKCYRTIAIDTRGHGQSEWGTAPFNFYTFANDVINVLNTLQIDKAHLIGFSDGATIALHVALIAPERIHSMILLGANYNPKGLRHKDRLLIQLAYAGLTVASPFSKKIRTRKKIWGLMVFQPNLTLEELSQITVPTLVATGENDMVRQRHNDELINAIKGSKRLVIPGGDHFWPLKKPDLFIQCVMDFFNELEYPKR